jgi:hypothetical protein
VIFNSMQARKIDALNFPMWQVARCTSAAPTYFSPPIITINETQVGLVDGGVCANNPSVFVLSEVRATRAKPEDDYLVVSIGCGRSEGRLDLVKARNWGLWGWKDKLIPLIFESNSQMADVHMEKLLPPAESGKRYYRLQVPITEDSIDSMDRTYLQTLQEKGSSLLGTEELSRLCNRLIALSENEAVAPRVQLHAADAPGLAIKNVIVAHHKSTEAEPQIGEALEDQDCLPIERTFPGVNIQKELDAASDSFSRAAFALVVVSEAFAKERPHQLAWLAARALRGSIPVAVLFDKTNSDAIVAAVQQRLGESVDLDDVRAFANPRTNGAAVYDPKILPALFKSLTEKHALAKV